MCCDTLDNNEDETRQRKEETKCQEHNRNWKMDGLGSRSKIGTNKTLVCLNVFLNMRNIIIKPLLPFLID